MTYLTGLSLMNPTVQISGVQFTDMEIYRLYYSGSLANVDYLLFEVDISDSNMMTILMSSSVNPMLCFEFDQNPILNTIGRSVVPCVKGFNLNQFLRANGQYSVYVPLIGTSFVYVSFGMFIQSVSVTYTVRIRAKFQSQTNDICPFNCGQFSSSYTNCNSMKCNCSIGKIDYDCSQSAILLQTFNTKISLTFNKMEYVYYIPDGHAKTLNSAESIGIQFSLQDSNQLVNVFITVEDVDPMKTVPTKDIYYRKITLGVNDYLLTIRPDILYNQFLDPKHIVFGFMLVDKGNTLAKNVVSVKVIDSYFESTNTNMIIIYFLVGVVGILFIIWITLTIIKIKYQHRTRVFDLASLQNAVSRTQRRTQGKKLTPQLIDQFMPIILFSEIAKKIKERGKSLNDACPVCLGEFENEDVCREAICNHYFHRDCLEQWLKKQENCPFCRADLSHEVLLKTLTVSNPQPPVEELINTQNVVDLNAQVNHNTFQSNIIASSIQLNSQQPLSQAQSAVENISAPRLIYSNQIRQRSSISSYPIQVIQLNSNINQNITPPVDDPNHPNNQNSSSIFLRPMQSEPRTAQISQPNQLELLVEPIQNAQIISQHVSIQDLDL